MSKIAASIKPVRLKDIEQPMIPGSGALIVEESPEELLKRIAMISPPVLRKSGKRYQCVANVQALLLHRAQPEPCESTHIRAWVLDDSDDWSSDDWKHLDEAGTLLRAAPLSIRKMRTLNRLLRRLPGGPFRSAISRLASLGTGYQDEKPR